ncbi:MAG: hypothetical protein NT161_00430 [Candidatus Nomurabacteria bacterium]|nr:hypothetical protein [Candidatus Nomurabacteria bacterium]
MEQININPESYSGEKKDIKVSHLIEKENPEKYAENLEILKSFSFYDDNQEFIDSFKKDLMSIDLTGLNNSTFVNIEAKIANKQRQGFDNVDLVENLINQNNERKILLYGFSNLDAIRKIKPKIDLLLAKENVKFTRLPFATKDAINILNSGMNKYIVGDKLQEIQDKEISHEVSVLLHAISNVRSAEDISQADPSRLARTIIEAKEYFPALIDKTDKEIVEFLFAIRQNVPEVMKGKNIEGVYCDIEGTLFNGEELNTKTLDILKKFEAQGKNITLWTDGDITKLQILLDTAGIKYPLKNKIDHAGASAEIVLDNDDNNTFSAKTKIYAKKFIKI